MQSILSGTAVDENHETGVMDRYSQYRLWVAQFESDFDTMPLRLDLD